MSEDTSRKDNHYSTNNLASTTTDSSSSNGSKVTDIEIIKNRKLEGLKIPLEKDVQAKNTSTYLEYVMLIHNALPELDIDEIDTSTTFLNHRFSAPIIIDSMTGGTDKATVINERLAMVAEELNLGMGVGSQRAGLLSDALRESYSIARKSAPNAFLIANIGGVQLKSITLDDVRRMIEMIDADAIAVHLNPLQELIQPEGEPKFKGIYSKIVELVKSIDVPVIVKEVGSGISRDVAVRLELAGVKAINIAGSGGTSWAGVEKLRADNTKAVMKSHLGELFWDWGIPTAMSLLEVRRSVRIGIIASGGLRSGLDIAKCIALGADICALAWPFLKCAAESKESVLDYARMLIEELRAAMFLTGSRDIKALRRVRYNLQGPLLEWFSVYGR
ncbi:MULTISPECIES: type 2 isopentenyl-diphosphate Delta-isomerase [Candidatus Nitrosocaldus]|jgi:isopentenyl-diphosphate delta-isomerase|uniref:Isopentenyl-diphosphate delta-isomerase n=1 Tax=Candidatus Nitrosocaldus cavascurensis TaxID=2058097 RepID=A0A2K5ASU7_9ARCH|nr:MULTISPECIES: type 2 isopentenyl-diphosphate Delta-isomerase [Candidatus Nitrosocaldus]SPC34684.1 isopentenyl-diphosphate delta-isomerase [Candidatus Nitrosocaldus cavascurensis]